MLFSRTDATAIPEAPILDAVEFAIEEINEAGGVLGRRIEPIVADGASDPAVFARKAAKLIDEDKVEVVFGCWSSPSRKRVAEVCSDPKRDRLLFYAGNSEGLEDYQNVVYLGGAPNQILTPLLRYAYSDLQRRKVFVVGSQSIYSRVISDLVEHEVTELQASIVGKRNIDRGEANFRSIVDEIKASQANFVVSSLSGADNVVLERALRGAGLKPPEVSTAWLTVTESNLAYFPPSLAGDYSAGCYFQNSETSDAGFVRRYRKHYGEEERLSDTMEAAFYGVYLWKQAVEKAKSTNTADVRQTLRGMTMDTPDGQIKIDTHSLHAWQTGQVSEILYSEATGLTFKTVYRTPEPVAPQLYPPWQTKEQWKQFVDGLFQEWGRNWEHVR